MTITTRSLGIIIAASLAALLFGLLFLGRAQGASSGITQVASSTAYAVSGTSVRLMASSSSARTAFTVQPINCAGGSAAAGQFGTP